MLFASTELAARIEGAQARLLDDFIECVRARRGDDAVFGRPIAGGFAAFAGPGSPLNKIIGVGLDGAVDEKELGAIETALTARGAPVQVEISCLADPTVGAMFSRRGYLLEGYLNALGCDLHRPEDTNAADGIEIRHCEEAALESWLDVMVTSFCELDAQGIRSHEEFSRDAIERAIGDTMRTAGMKQYLAMIDGQPVGGASLRIADGLAQLCGAATLPAFRRRGVQRALLGARRVDAGEAGCDLALVDVLPGSKSQENVQRQGFELLYSRAVLVRHT